MSIIIELLALTSLAALIAAGAIGVMHWLASRMPVLKWERRRELSLRTRKHSNNKGEMSKVKTLLIAVGLVVGMSSLAYADEFVNPYTRRDGVQVPGHYRSSPDGDRSNNWSVAPNINPYTGERGTRSPYDNPSPTFPNRRW